MEPSTILRQQIIDFITKGDDFFVNWLNGTIDQEGIKEIEDLIHEDARIFYSERQQLVSKNALVSMLPSIYGSTRDDSISRSKDILKVEQLNEHLVLIAYLEHTHRGGEIFKTRPVSILSKM